MREAIHAWLAGWSIDHLLDQPANQPRTAGQAFTCRPCMRDLTIFIRSIFSNPTVHSS
jgi:hypothetical protein